MLHSIREIIKIIGLKTLVFLEFSSFIFAHYFFIRQTVTLFTHPLVQNNLIFCSNQLKNKYKKTKGRILCLRFLSNPNFHVKSNKNCKWAFSILRKASIFQHSRIRASISHRTQSSFLGLPQQWNKLTGMRLCEKQEKTRAQLQKLRMTQIWVWDKTNLWTRQCNYERERERDLRRGFFFI